MTKGRDVFVYVETDKTGKHRLLSYLTYRVDDSPGLNVVRVDEPNGRRAKQLAEKLVRQALADGERPVNVEYRLDWIDGIEKQPRIDQLVHVCAIGGPRHARFSGWLDPDSKWPVFDVVAGESRVPIRFWSDELTGREVEQ